MLVPSASSTTRGYCGQSRAVALRGPRRRGHLRVTGWELLIARRLYQLPDARGRKRKLARLHVECAERIGDGIGHDTAGRDDAALAGALGAERVDRGGGVFQHDGADVREVAGGRDKVVGERAGQELGLLVVDKMLHHGTAQPLHRRAYGLTVYRQRVDDAAAILDDDIVDEHRVTELGI